VSICFSPHAASEQPSFLTSPATPRSPIMHSYSANQQPDRSAYTYQQLQWTGGVPSHASNGPAKMEVDESAQPSPSSSSNSALSRTLLPIGQSRCIEYFHFLWWTSGMEEAALYAGPLPLGAYLEWQMEFVSAVGGNISVPGLKPDYTGRGPIYWSALHREVACCLLCIWIQATFLCLNDVKNGIWTIGVSLSSSTWMIRTEWVLDSWDSSICLFRHWY
jgi:hypothetical protein